MQIYLAAHTKPGKAGCVHSQEQQSQLEWEIAQGKEDPGCPFWPGWDLVRFYPNFWVFCGNQRDKAPSHESQDRKQQWGKALISAMNN